MVVARGALIPIATGFRLKAHKPDGRRYHVAGRVMNVPAEALGWHLTLGREGLSGLSNDEHPARSGFGEVLVIYPPYLMGVPSTILILKHLKKRGVENKGFFRKLLG